MAWVVTFMLMWLGVCPQAIGAALTPAGTVINSSAASMKFTWKLTATNALFGDSRNAYTDTAYDTVQFLSLLDVATDLETAFIRPQDTYVFVKHILNLGNGVDTYQLRADSTQGLVRGFFIDADGDSAFDGSDPPVSTIILPALSETVVLIRLDTSPAAADGSTDSIRIVVTSNAASRPSVETAYILLTVDSSAAQVSVTGPPAGHETTSVSVVVTWSAVTDSVGIDSYVVEVSKVSSFGTLTFVDTVDMVRTSDTITGLYNDTTYFRVRAVDNLGNIGMNSSVRGFVVDTSVGQVIAASPADGHETTNASVVVAWSALTDSVGIDSYVVEASKTSVFGILVFADTIAGSRTSDTLTGLYNDTYFWRVRGIDHRGNIGTNLAALGFVVDTAAGKVVLTSPSSGALTSDTTPTLTWTALTDSVGIDSYVIEVSKFDTFSPIAFADTVDSSVASDTVQPFLVADTYYWRVRGIDHLGNVGSNSDSFQIRIDTTPISVSLLNPADATETNVVSVPFTWTATAADTFVWQLSTGSTFTTIADSVVDTTATSLTRTVSPNDTYYWRVIGTNSLGYYDTASARAFLVDTSVDQVSVTSPSAGYETTNASVAVTWSAVTDSVGIDSYVVEASKTSSFGILTFADTVDVARTSDTITSLYNDTYYFRVRAIDNLGNIGANSSARGFIVDTSAGQVSAVSPSAGHETTNASVVVVWSALADSLGIDSYVVEASKESAFGSLVFADTVAGARTSDTLTGIDNDTFYWRVRGIDHVGNIGANSSARGFVVDTTAGQVVLVSPIDGVSVSDSRPPLMWTALTDSVGIDTYLIELSPTASFAALTFADTVSGSKTSDTPASTLANGTYYWRVRAIDHAGNHGAASDTFSFTVSTAVSVTLLSPSAGHETTAVSIQFVWTSASADTYTWQMSRSSTFATVSDSVVDTTATSVTKTLTTQDTYYWRVVGRDRVGNMDTQTRGFVIDSTVGQVSVVSPANGHETSNAKPVVTWTARTDSVGIDSYVVEVSRSPAFTTFAFADTVSGSRLSDTLTGLGNDTYYWRVRAIDYLRNVGATSDTRGFVLDTFVAKVSLLLPADNHDTNSTKPVVSWTALTDSVGIDSYAVEVSKSSSFTTIVFADTVSVSRTSDTLTGLYNDTYYWRVRGVDRLKNIGANSDTRRIRVDTQNSSITLTSPADSSATSDSTPTLSWSATAPTGIASFKLYVAKMAAFATLAFQDTLAGAVFSDTTSALTDDTYYWKIIATDNIGNTTVSSKGVFIIDRTPPTAPISIFPANNQETSNIRPVFGWTAASDTPSGIYGYRLEISRDSRFTSFVFASDTVRGALETSPASDLSTDTYYWRVVAIDNAGNTATVSVPFKISLIEPTGAVTFDQTEYKGYREVAQIRLIDALANLSPLMIDVADITVLSDVDPTGFTMQLTETGENTNQFVGTIQFTGGNSDLTSRKIKVSPGSGVTGQRIQTNGRTVSGSARWLSEQGEKPPEDLSNTRSWPNPWNPTSGEPLVIQNLPADPTMTIEIYTVSGTKIRSLYNGRGISASAFGNSAQWDGKNDGGQYVSSGVYLYVVRSNAGTVVRKITLVK